MKAEAGATSAFERALVWAAGLRLALLVYGAWHDLHLEVKYTDIDYDVFSDGAELVYRGASPFERPDRPRLPAAPLCSALLTSRAWAHRSLAV